MAESRLAARLDGWCDRRGAWVRRGVFLILGVLTGCGQAPLDAWFAALPALALFLGLALPGPGARAAFGAGFWFGFGYALFTFRWIVSPFLVDAARDGWMAPFALIFMALGLALIWGTALWAAFRFFGARLIAGALMLTLAEVARSLLLTGFPWALLGHILIPTPLAQLAAFGGPHLLTLTVLLLAWSLWPLLGRKWLAGALPLAAVVPAMGLAPGPAPDTDPDAPIIRLVQPNAPQDEKWDIDKRGAFLDRMLAFSAEAPRPDLIVWPETAIPELLEWADTPFEMASEAAQGVPLVTGINRRERARYYNALVVLERGAQVRAIYDKAHLVPFGEYVPGGELAARLGLHGFAASEGQAFSTGGVQPLLDLPGIGAARALICYEGIFAEEIGTPTRPRLLLLITNDAWFGDGAGPAQHLAQARLRSIEQGLPMVRVANTGISAMIDAKGRVVAALPLGQAGALDVPLPAALAATPYTRWGDLPLLFVLALGLLGLVLWRRPT